MGKIGEQTRAGKAAWFIPTDGKKGMREEAGFCIGTLNISTNVLINQGDLTHLFLMHRLTFRAAHGKISVPRV